MAVFRLEVVSYNGAKKGKFLDLPALTKRGDFVTINSDTGSHIDLLVNFDRHHRYTMIL